MSWPDGDVVGELVAEVGLQLRAVFALWLGEDLDIDWGVVEAGGDAEAVFAHRQRRLVGITLRGAGDLLGAANRSEQKANRQ